MFRRHPNAREVSLRVARLPLDYFVCRLAEHWIVVGPTGIFVVGSQGKDPHAAADAALTLARRIRSRLSDLVPWVPFIDAVLVAGDDLHLPCTTVRIDSLEMALQSGPRAIDDAGMDQLRRHVPEVLTEIVALTEAADTPLLAPPTLGAPMRPIDSI